MDKAQSLVGKTVEQARIEGHKVRVIQLNGKSLRVTRDIVVGRINVEAEGENVENAKITRISMVEGNNDF